MEFLKDVAAELAATILIGCGVVSWKYRTQEAREALWVAVARWRTAMFRKVSKLLGRARGAPRGAIIVYALGISCCIGTFAGIALEPANGGDAPTWAQALVLPFYLFAGTVLAVRGGQLGCQAIRGRFRR